LGSTGTQSSEHSSHFSLRSNPEYGSSQQVHIWKCAFVGLSSKYGSTSEAKPRVTLMVSFCERFVPTGSSTKVPKINVEINQLNALKLYTSLFYFTMASTCFGKTMPSSGSDYFPF
jgi:hypothetical protein